MRSFFLDLKLALRQLRKSPGFTATALLMLAFGIGATTAIFSIVDGVLLRPLPFPESNRLVHVGDHLQGVELGEGAPATAVDIIHYARDTHSFTALGGYGDTGYELSGTGEPAQVTASRMTPGVFDVLQVAPILGRTFTAEEDQQRQRLAVLSYDAWQNRFHGSPQILGTKLLLDRNPYVVIGVMPRSFEFPLEPGHLNRTELWIPMSFRPEEMANQAANWRYNIVARLKPGVTVTQAQSDVDRISKNISRTYGAVLGGIQINGVVLSQQDATIFAARPLVRTLFVAVVVVLLIACTNLAGLLLVRAIRRQREFALRRALGASSSALLRQMLLESLVLSLAGGLFGIVVADTALRLGKNLLPESLPRISEINLNWPVAAFALALAVVTGLVCGLAPAFAALRTSLNETLKEGGRGGSSGGHARLRSVLVVSEIAIALVLLTASGLLLRSFEKMRQVDLGFRPEAITTASYSLPEKQYATQAATNAFNMAVLRRLGQLPGVQAVGLTNVLPGSGSTNANAIVPEGYVPPKGSRLTLNSTSLVVGDFFRALGTPLLRGRYLNDDDRAGTQLVTVVNHKFATLYWPNQDPIGKRMHLGTFDMHTPWLTVVGEVADVKLGAPDSETQAQSYVQINQFEDALGSMGSPSDNNGGNGSIVLRSAMPPEQMENALRTVVRSIDPQLPLSQVETMNQVLAESEAPRRFNTVIITAFAVAAVLLAVLGIYSIIAFSVATRTQEMAIRMALGSQRAGILRLILTGGIKLAAIGCAVGLAGSVAASSLLRSMLFGVSPFDLPVLSMAAVAILILTLAASALPASRAASIDPVQGLRAE